MFLALYCREAQETLFCVITREDTSVVRRYENNLDNKALFFVKFVLFVTVLWTLFVQWRRQIRVKLQSIRLWTFVTYNNDQDLYFFIYFSVN